MTAAAFLCINCQSWSLVEDGNRPSCCARPCGTFTYDTDGTIEGARARYRSTFGEDRGLKVLSREGYGVKGARVGP